MVKTYVYVDGFNLYYGGLKGTKNKWLDQEALFKKLLKPECEIIKIKYFTAMVKARPGDPQQPQRQQTYLRALRTNPKIEIKLGHFLSHPKHLPNAKAVGKTQVIVTEEKGSDVNLATSMIMDAFWNSYDLAVLVSNDSDFREPVMQVRGAFNKCVGILNPHNGPKSIPSSVLRSNANFFHTIRPSFFTSSQLPSSMQDANGTITKPAAW